MSPKSDPPSKQVRKAKPVAHNLKPRSLRTKAAAAYLGLSPWSLRNEAARGELAVRQTCPGAPFYFDISDLDGWAERHKKLTPE